MISLAALCLLGTACSTSKNGCGSWQDVQRHDSKPFRVQYIRPAPSGGVLVGLRRYRKTLEVLCSHKPDSIQVGCTVYL